MRTVDSALMERLALFIEESGEGAQIGAKALRFGMDDVFNTGNGPKTVRERIEDEAGDILHAIELLIVNGDIRRQAVYERLEQKSRDVRNWMSEEHIWVDL